MLYVSEYKAPHKLTAPLLRVGLHPMDIFKDVVNRKTIPTAADPDGRFQYYAERLTAAAITQTYNYMIEGDLDAEEHHACTAVGQYLAFSLMALGPPGNPPNVRSQDERQRVILELRRWAEDFETTLRSIPRDERYAPSGSSSGSLYAPTTYAGISRSPRVPRARPKRWAQEEDRPDVQPRFRDRDTSLRRMSARLRCRTPRHRLSRGRVVRAKAHGAASAFWAERRAGKLHTRATAKAAAADHLIDRDEFLRLLFQQLQESLDHGISRLDVGGSRGVLFKISLMAYGYTFVAKGTVFAFIRDLEHEI
ncbi:hypothetical protein TruAng_011831 [Truncatella angustata]|nr:hypothetical protein TruAng_011831 [Truncatella angustata]